ncbi:MAG: YraN family protein [Cyanobacteria bacterium]|nr:YraN family protein [Cyanobacteriota bacterium]
MKTVLKANDSRRKIGLFGEWLAAAYLKSLGWQIEARGWRFGRSSEIDIVACIDDSFLVFVEVKTRRVSCEWQEAAASAFDTITMRKQNRLAAMSQRYILQTQSKLSSCRFDVVFVGVDPGLYRQISSIEHLFGNHNSSNCSKSPGVVDSPVLTIEQHDSGLLTVSATTNDLRFSSNVLHVENALT